VSGEELDRATQERDRRRRLLVGQDLGVGQAGRVVDGDVDCVPAVDASPDPEPSVILGLPFLARPAVMRLPAPLVIRPSFLTSMWISSPGIARS
jgi:hypothetical protein